MPYQAKISRDNPTCFLFVIDQSPALLQMADRLRMLAVKNSRKRSFRALAGGGNGAEGHRRIGSGRAVSWLRSRSRPCIHNSQEMVRK
jgi:hypothetical protein